MPNLTTLKTGGRAALVAIVLSATALVAMPAQAAGPNINFSLQLGNGNGFGGNGVFLNFGGPQKLCLSDKQIRFQLQQSGWKQAKVVKNLGGTKVAAVGRWQGDWFQMRVDRCTGKVDKVKPVYFNNGPNGGNGNGFSITLGF